VCSTTFNALENLSEQAFNPAAEPEPPSPDDSMTVEELPGGENIELSAPVELAVVADAPLPDTPPPPPAPGTGEDRDDDGTDELPPDDDDDEQRALEFHGDAADLDRLFVVDESAIAHFDPTAADGPPVEENPVIDLDSTDEHPILVLDERDEPPDGQRVESIVLETPAEETAPLQAPAAQPQPSASPPRPPAPPATPAATGHTAPRILIPDEMRKRLAQEAEARAAAAALFEPEPEEKGPLLSRQWPWVAGVSALAVLLLLQVLHAERNELVRNPAFGPALAATYDFFGSSVLAPTDPTSYELRQWGAASDPKAANRLMLRASIVNRATYAQPLPLLRLSLQDRFGGTLHQRDIAPPDYLPGAGDAGLLAPGERADVLIRIVDPGSEVVGFELDVCLPARGGVRCANPIQTAGP
jgi:hypothetical protein